MIGSGGDVVLVCITDTGVCSITIVSVSSYLKIALAILICSGFLTADFTDPSGGGAVRGISGGLGIGFTRIGATGSGGVKDSISRISSVMIVWVRGASTIRSWIQCSTSRAKLSVRTRAGARWTIKTIPTKNCCTGRKRGVSLSGATSFHGITVRVSITCGASRASATEKKSAFSIRKIRVTPNVCMTRCTISRTSTSLNRLTNSTSTPFLTTCSSAAGTYSTRSRQNFLISQDKSPRLINACHHQRVIAEPLHQSAVKHANNSA